MAITIVCPSCGFKGRVPNHYEGMRIKCRQCQNAFVATAPSEEDQATAFLSDEEEGLQEDE